MIVGYEKGYYPEKRCIVDKAIGVQYTDITFTDSNLVLQKIQERLSLRPFNLNLFKYHCIVKPKVDLIHFFNSISYSVIPWVSTFETFLPRFQELYSYHHGEDREIVNRKKVESALRHIAMCPCKRIIALSECARKIQVDLLNHFPEYMEPVVSKLEVIHPPQELLVSDLDHKNYDRLHFVFLGGALHRKGGVEVLKVFNKLRNQFDFKLTIISRLLNENYATQETDEDIRNIRKFLEEAKWIDYHEYLPNNEAMEVLKNCHIGLLPTWADSYGYSLLEYQAAGCPVISTNVRAMPEINNNEVGWIIEIPKNNLGEALYNTKVQRELIKETIETDLENILLDIFAHPEQVKIKALRCLERIRQYHSPREYGERLMRIYEGAFQTSPSLTIA
jgi:glycosyltransferase involved in cell wall biosynthesis